MSDMHVLEGDHGRWKVVMHFAVPGGSNSAGVSWQSALVTSGIGGTTVLVDGDGTGGTISAAEKATIAAGAALEHVAMFLVESGGTSAVNIRDSLREFYAAEKSDKVTQLQILLKYFGATESES